MSASSFQKDLPYSLGPTDSSSLNAPLQQYLAPHPALSRRMNSLRNSFSNASPVPSDPVPSSLPATVVNRWTSPLASLDSCNAGSVISGVVFTAKTTLSRAKDLYEGESFENLEGK